MAITDALRTYTGPGRPNKSQNFGVKTSDAASKAGFGNEETFRQARKVVDQGAPELVEAIRRCGELLKQFDGRPENAKQSGGAPTLVSQRQVAEQAGLSKRQQVTAVRVANVPEGEFEGAVNMVSPSPSFRPASVMGNDKARWGTFKGPAPIYLYIGPGTHTPTIMELQ